MSKNRNRAKLNKALINIEYKILFLKEKYPPYWDDGLVYYGDNKKHKRGFLWDKRPRKRLLFYQVRMYKTWKHNRKTQYRQI